MPPWIEHGQEKYHLLALMSHQTLFLTVSASPRNSELPVSLATQHHNPREANTIHQNHLACQLIQVFSVLVGHDIVAKPRSGEDETHIRHSQGATATEHLRHNLHKVLDGYHTLLLCTDGKPLRGNTMALSIEINGHHQLIALPKGSVVCLKGEETQEK